MDELSLSEDSDEERTAAVGTGSVGDVAFKVVLESLDDLRPVFVATDSLSSFEGVSRSSSSDSLLDELLPEEVDDADELAFS